MVNTLKRKIIFEFIFIFIIIPLLVILNNEKLFIFITLLLFFFISIFLLKNTKNFSFKSFSKKIDWKYICFFSCLFLIAGFIYTVIIDKNLLFNLPANNFSLWVIVILVYPFFSVIPQEFIFRVLFFERYENLFKSQNIAILVNSIIFAYIHLVFQNFHAVFITAITSPIFAYAYLKKSFLTCIIIHSIGGQIIFSYGLGKFFY